ncbi:DUF5677 domain-containing protein [Vibrio splendidus]|uniref:DUF5677 domain-containing protein n=1 Tax=Vibrio splendidus TaxID=29497 RepID=UPI001E2A8BEA|nr:DUF5677 domain-containing protein [Vibrio splendidus]MCC4859190.1 DUF5677 domain-containing protein [Vibrio splendidus]
MANKKKNKGKLDSHQKKGSSLIAPFNQIPNRNSMSWVNDRLPCMLWAGLLINGLGRDNALEVFREIGTKLGLEHKGIDEGEKKMPRIGLYGLSIIDKTLKNDFFNVLSLHPESKSALRPLLLLDCLPMREKWLEFCGEVDVKKEDWKVLAQTTALLLDHQSQEATDCRWAYLLPSVNSGMLVLQNEEQYKEFQEYPYYQDQRKVRPFIRSTEMSISNTVLENDSYKTDKEIYSRAFWAECKNKTDCFISSPAKSEASFNITKTLESIESCWGELSQHFVETDTFTHVQAKRDASFGFCFYALTISREGLLSSGIMVTSKFALRVLAELYITFSYLVATNDKKMWDVYRTYGSSQAKLTFIKLEEVLEDKPEYLKKSQIESLANEDIYMDFQDIELGNWAKIDLRKMSIIGKCKDIYDAYYSWPSTYAHGQWCAVRDTVFTTCLNPLHRLHRVPLPRPKYEDHAEKDLVKLTNMTLDLLNKIYPTFEHRLLLVRDETC